MEGPTRVTDTDWGRPEGRRVFLKTLARGALYSIPVVHTLAAPEGVVAQGKSTQKKMGMQGMGMGMGMGNNQSIEDLGATNFGPAAPWSMTPPGG